MADLLNFLPFIGNTPLFGPPRSQFLSGESELGKGGAPPVWGEQPDHTSIAGVPIAPLLGGLATAMIARSLAPKYQRGRATGAGFMLGNQLFSRPIDEEKANRQAVFRAMVEKGWINPFGGAPGAPGTTPATPSGTAAGGPGPLPPIQDIKQASGNIPLVSPSGTFPAAASPQAPQRVIRFGGIPFNLSPAVSMGDLFPGQNLPPSMAGAQLPVSGELAKLAMEGAERKKAQDYLVSQGMSPNQPMALALEDYRIKHGLEMLPKYREALPTDDNTGMKIGIGSDGRPQISTFTAPPALTNLKRDAFASQAALRQGQLENAHAQLELHRQAQQIQMDQFGTTSELSKKRLELEQAKLDKFKSETGKLSTTELRQLTGMATQERLTYTNLLADIEKRKDALGQLSPEDTEARNNAVSELSRIGQEVSGYSKILAERTGVKIKGDEAQEVSPEQKADHARVSKYLNAFRAMSKPEKFDSLPAPKDPAELEAHSTAKQVFQRQTEPAIGAIGEAMRNEHWWASKPNAETEAYLRSVYPDTYDIALKMWNASRK